MSNNSSWERRAQHFSFERRAQSQTFSLEACAKTIRAPAKVKTIEQMPLHARYVCVVILVLQASPHDDASLIHKACHVNQTPLSPGLPLVPGLRSGTAERSTFDSTSLIQPAAVRFLEMDRVVIKGSAKGSSFRSSVRSGRVRRDQGRGTVSGQNIAQCKIFYF